MKDVYISGPMGSREFDARLLSMTVEDDIALHLSGQLSTKGVYRWGQHAIRNLGRGWTVDGDAEISLEPSDRDNQPLFCLAGQARSVSGITVRGNHSVLAEDWPGSLRTGGVCLYGLSRIAGVTFRDFGATRAPSQPKEISSETFVAEIVGGGSITGCKFLDHDLSSTDDQVSVFRIMASENGERMSDVPCLMEKNRTNAPGSQWVQGHTIYGLPGMVRYNNQVGGYSLYYGDYFKTKGVNISFNEAENVTHGVALKLSPGEYSHEDYTIGPNRFASSSMNVLLDPCGPMTARRYIRGITVDASLSVLNRGAEFMFTGVERSKAKGCFR